MSDEEKKSRLAAIEKKDELPDSDESESFSPWKVKKVESHHQLAALLTKLDEEGYAPRFIIPREGETLLVVAGLMLDGEFEDTDGLEGLDDED